MQSDRFSTDQLAPCPQSLLLRARLGRARALRERLLPQALAKNRRWQPAPKDLGQHAQASQVRHRLDSWLRAKPLGEPRCQGGHTEPSASQSESTSRARQERHQDRKQIFRPIAHRYSVPLKSSLLSGVWPGRPLEPSERAVYSLPLAKPMT